MRGTGSRLVAEGCTAIVTPKPMAASRGSLGERDLEPRPSTIIKWTGPRPSLAPTCASADQCPAPCGRVARVRWAHAAGREDLFRLGCQGKPPPPRFSRLLLDSLAGRPTQPPQLTPAPLYKTLRLVDPSSFYSQFATAQTDRPGPGGGRFNSRLVAGRR